MQTIEELKKELEREKNYEENQKEMGQLGRERKKLKREIFKKRLVRQNPWLKTVGRVGSGVGKGLVKIADNLEKSSRIDEELRKKKLKKQIKNLKTKKYKKRVLPKATINTDFNFVYM